MVFCERDDENQALPPQRADEPFAEGVRLWTLGWCFQHLEPQMAYAVVELGREDTIAVMHEEAIAMVRWDRLTQLLECPVSRGMRRHIAVEHEARGMLHHDKHVEQAKGRRHDHAEVTGDDRRGMIADKRPPALGWRVFPPTVTQVLRQVLPDGAWWQPLGADLLRTRHLFVAVLARAAHFRADLDLRGPVGPPRVLRSG